MTPDDVPGSYDSLVEGVAPGVVALDVLEARVWLHVTEPVRGGLEDAVRRAWSQCLAPDVEAPAVEHLHLRVGPDDSSSMTATSVTGSNERVLLERLSGRVTLDAITRHAGEHLLLHACGLLDSESGTAVALVGPSGGGKTTLAATLGQSLGYLTDEMLAVRADHRVLAYPKPLSVLRVGDAVKEQVSPDELDLVSATSGAPLGAVLLIERDGTSPPRLEPVSNSRALADLATHTSYLARVPRPLRRLADMLDAVGGLRRLRYRDATEVGDLVREALSR